MLCPQWFTHRQQGSFCFGTFELGFYFWNYKFLKFWLSRGGHSAPTVQGSGTNSSITHSTASWTSSLKSTAWWTSRSDLGGHLLHTNSSDPWNTPTSQQMNVPITTATGSASHLENRKISSEAASGLDYSTPSLQNPPDAANCITNFDPEKWNQCKPPSFP